MEKIYFCGSFVVYDSGEQNQIFWMRDNGDVVEATKITVPFRFLLQKKINKFINFIRFIGSNNSIFLAENNRYHHVHISLGGGYNEICVHKSPHLICANFNMDWQNYHRKVKILNDFSCGQADIVLNEDFGELHIGNDVMVSFGVILELSDGHAIFDRQNGNVLNNISINKIGNHVWIGRNSVVLKNCDIPSNSIIAHSSVVTKKFKEESSIIGGCPAKILKNNIEWSRENPSIAYRSMNNIKY